MLLKLINQTLILKPQYKDFYIQRAIHMKVVVTQYQLKQKNIFPSKVKSQFPTTMKKNYPQSLIPFCPLFKISSLL